MKITGVREVPDDGPDFGGQADFATFYRLHRRSLEQWYRRRWRLSPQDAADVAQETFAGLAFGWARLRTDEHRRRSYATISRYKVVDFLRTQQRRVQSDMSLDDQGVELVADEATTNPAVIFGGQERESPLWAAVERLSKPQRDAVLGRAVFGLVYDELAETTGRTVTAVRQDFSRGRSWLRRLLKAPAVVLLALFAKARRSLSSSATGTAFTVATQATLLGLVFTAPLHVLPRRDTVADALRSLPPGVTQLAPNPVANLVIATVEATSRVPAPRRHTHPESALPVPRRPRPRIPSTPTVNPPDVCLVQRTCERERITVRVLGIEQGATQSWTELCWAFPAAAEPHVTCRREGDPP